ncbi:MAG: oxidase [Chloroflexi bacterium]|nr:MAG: oxidase [Chloroflexota bacterium]
MSTQNNHARKTPWDFWRRNSLIWAALMALLVLSLVLAHVSMGSFTVAAGIVIALVQAGLICVLFMELIEARPLIRLAAMSGVIFVAVLFALTLADVLSRVAGR